MIAPELGFTTGGSCMMRAEIPVGWHTGKHLHGEEAIYVESGDGCIILDDKRYDFIRARSFMCLIDRRINCLIPVMLRWVTFPDWPGIWKPRFTWAR